ncbi:MAG: pantoate--beta-alanine ligase [Bacteroidetes bacterium]|nr:pantoate--beta-alanine ligase [Bacteroidota bacterium]
MIISKRINETKVTLDLCRKRGMTIGFVPTMGALHQGHLELVKRAKRENDYMMCSIFVNPIQFNNKSDLEKYPRETESDLEKLKKNGCDLLFMPSEEEMYPEPVTTVFDFGQLDKLMEGQYRPGHFNGVAIVVKKLFEIIEPDRAYFGEKDFQQLAIVRHMNKTLDKPVQIVACPTVREQDGLAMSSRNTRLTPGERALAPFIYQVLQGVKNNAGKQSVAELKSWVSNQFDKYPAMRLEYFAIVEMQTLTPIEKWDNSPNIIACIAVYLGNVRLIDNIVLFS